MKRIKKSLTSSRFFCKIYAQLKVLIKNQEKQNVLKEISKYYGEDFVKDKKYVNEIIKDVFFCGRYYGTEDKEYFLYHFEQLSDKKRAEFISIEEKNEIIKKLSYGKQKYKDILNDKYQSYNKFKEYYKREIVKIVSNKDKEIFEEFCKKHSSFLVKPYDSKQGKGISIINQNDYNSIEDVWLEISKYGAILLEEIIVQDNRLAKFHPQSVNTIRFVTYIKDSKVSNLSAFLRIGRGDSIVDNISAGGISANIDLETGIITSDGIAFSGEHFLKHPDTDVCIIGYQIPEWKELCNIVESAAKLLPEYEYISWDLAFSEKGWLIVEGNAEGSLVVSQMFGDGIREKFENASK